MLTQALTKSGVHAKYDACYKFEKHASMQVMQAEKHASMHLEDLKMSTRMIVICIKQVICIKAHEYNNAKKIERKVENNRIVYIRVDKRLVEISKQY